MTGHHNHSAPAHAAAALRERSAARSKPNQGGCLVVAALVLMVCLYANNPAVQDADDGIALRLARVAELDVELQGHAALRHAARSDVALARAQAEHVEAPPVPPPPPRQQRREVLTTKPESQKDWGYTFWSSDFHISPIADLKDLFAPMGMRIIDESLSGHCHLKNVLAKSQSDYQSKMVLRWTVPQPIEEEVFRGLCQ